MRGFLAAIVAAFIVVSTLSGTPLLAQNATPTPAPEPPPEGMLWPDGSLNFQADLEKSKQAPLEIAELLEAAPAQDGPARDDGKAPMLVFPFRDVTADGVGAPIAMGWHSVGTAALALWTNAEPLSPDDIWSIGAPALDSLTTTTLTTIPEWAGHIRDQQSVPAEAVVISGLFRDGDTTGTPVVELFWLKPGERTPTPILTEAAGDPAKMEGLLKLQRAQAKKLAEFVVKEGLATANTGSGANPGAEFEAELRRIVIAANSRHSWLIQEAVNRALLLARRYPNESAPLQAAAYAQTALRSSIFALWESGRFENFKGAMRALATAQLATELAPNASGPTVLLWFNLQDLGLGKVGLSTKHDPGGWAWLGSYRIGKARLYYEPDGAQLPDWFVLRLCSYNIWYFGTSGFEPYRDTLLAKRDECDLLSTVLVWKLPRLLRSKSFSVQQEIAAMTFANDIRSFVALNLEMLAKSDPTRAAELAGRVTRTDPAGLVKKASESPFLQLREALGPVGGNGTAARSNWNIASRGRPGKYIAMLDVAGALRRHPPAQVNDPARSGFEGIEYSPRLRFQEYGARMEQGPVQQLTFLAESFSYRPAWEALQARIESAMPAAASPYWLYRSYLAQRDADEGEKVEEAKALTRSVAAAFPTDRQSQLALAQLESVEGNPAAGFAIIQECRRIGRYDKELNLALAEFYRTAQFRRLAAKYYGLYLKTAPTAYQHMGHYLELKRDLGDKSSHLEILQKSADAVPGNGTVVEQLLRYQLYTLKDYPGTLKSIEKYKRMAFRRNFDAWRLEVARESGDKEGALRIIDAMKPDEEATSSSLAMASFHAAKGMEYLDEDRLEQAKQELARARSFDSSKGSVILLAIKIAFAEENWEEMERQIGECERRYGATGTTRAYLAEVYSHTNRREKAIAIMAAYLRKHPRDVFFTPKLVRFLGEEKLTSDAEEVMVWALKSPSLTPTIFWQLLGNYKAINPQAAAALEKQRDKYLNGPRTEAEALAWEKERRETPLPALLAR